MKSQRIDIASIRREQIVEAAAGVISEQGLQKLSLSEIEKKAGMSRGQLTYYFPTKEDILLAVFDRLVELTCQRIGTPAGLPCEEASAWSWIEHLFERLLLQPATNQDFTCLQYTFLSQIGHRKDFRQRLAGLYEQWRGNMAKGLDKDLGPQSAPRVIPPRAMATLVQAILHGLAMQRAADPKAFDALEMLDLSLDVLGTYLWNRPRARGKRKPNGRQQSVRPNHRPQRRLSRRQAATEVNGERAIRK